MEKGSNITIIQTAPLVNTKASEEYIQVVFSYPDVKSEWHGWVPIEYRRTGVSIARDDVVTLMAYLESIYVQLHPSNYSSWVKQQDEYWDATRSVETKQIFNILKDGQWHCRNCDISNPNFARRIQDLKEMGYTISTHVNYRCPVCGNRG